MNCKKILAALVACALLLAACGSTAQSTGTAVKSETLAATVTALEDKYMAPSEENVITLNGSSATFNGSKGVTISGSTVTITAAGHYTLTGTLADGQIVVDATDKGTVNLTLNGASITSNTSAALYVKQASETVLSLANGTENTLTDAATYTYANTEENEPNACLYAADDLWLCGGGALTVNGNYADAIHGKDTVTLADGTYVITAADDGIVGKDSLTMGGGSYTVTAVADALKATNDADAALGTVTLLSGTYTLTAGNDGVQAETLLTVQGGDYTITTGGGSENAATKTQNQQFGMGGGMRGGPDANAGATISTTEGTDAVAGATVSAPDEADTVAGATTAGTPPTDMPGTPPTEKQSGAAQGRGTQAENTQPQTAEATAMAATAEAPAAGSTATTDATESTSDSYKGLKAAEIAVNGGTFVLNTCDDAVHANGDATINGGSFTIATGDDAFHADATLTINDGSILVTASYEGLEGMAVCINGGTIDVTASDDGVNAAGGDGSGQFGFAQDSFGSLSEDEIDDADVHLTITGGSLTVHADGDGLDTNGSGYISGGTVIVYGPTNSGNGALDYDGTFLVDGGTLVALGAAGMAQSPSTGSTVPCISTNGTINAGDVVTVTTQSGEEVYTVTAEKAAQNFIFSSDALQEGATYTVSSNGTALGSVTLAAGVNTIGTAQGGAMQGAGGTRPGRG